MFAKVNSIGLFGMSTYPVSVEVSVDRGLPRCDIVGLPDLAVSESRERVRAAIKNSGFFFPASRVTINLSPADKRKEGSMYDLPITVALLLATGQLRQDVGNSAFIGELSLNGDVRRVDGILPMVIHAKESGLDAVFVPAQNAAESCVVDGIDIFPVTDCKTLLDHLSGRKALTKATPDMYPQENLTFGQSLDFSDVKGQFMAKRALEIAAAGGHNLLMVGPPGSGKSMLAKRLPTILPDMTEAETMETTKIYSIAGQLSNNQSLITKRPFRAPHHTISAVGLSGGGRVPKPGELSLSHNGVLFLDELPEFPRASMEAMRQPIEDGVITITRVSGSLTYPCETMLVCAMNPCPCGYYGHPTHKCTCRPEAVSKYLSRVSGPLLDRIDLHVEVPPVDFEKLSDNSLSESSATIRARVNAAREIQHRRFEGTSTSCNAKMTAAQTRKFCELDEQSKALLERCYTVMGLSARAYDKILRIARTIADLSGSASIQSEHMAEAVQYRSLDQKIWRG